MDASSAQSGREHLSVRARFAFLPVVGGGAHACFLRYLQRDSALPLDDLSAQGDFESKVLAVSVIAKLQIEGVVETPLHLFGQPLEGT